MAKSNTPSENTDYIDLKETLVSLWHGRWVIASTSVLAISAGLVTLANSDPTYQADALIQLEDRGGSMALPETMRELVDGASSGESELEIMRSRMVLSQAVVDLDLDRDIEAHRAPVFGTILARHELPAIIENLLDTAPLRDFIAPYARPSESLSVEQLIMPPEWLGDAAKLTVTPDGYEVALPDGREITGQQGDLLTDPPTGFSLLASSIDAPPGRKFTLRQLTERAASERLRGGMSATENPRDSGIITVRMTGPSTGEAESRLDAALQAYVRQNINRSVAEAERSLEFISEQLPRAEQELREAEERLSSFREDATARALDHDADDPLGGDLDFMSRSLLDRIARLDADLDRIDRRAERNADSYPEDHPFFRQLDQERANVEDQLSDLLERVEDLPSSQRDIINLQRDVEIAQQTYAGLQARAQEMEVLQASTVGSVRIVDDASARGIPIEPRRNRTLALAALAGLIGGSGMVFMRNWMRRGLRSAEDLAEADLPVLGVVNYAPKADQPRRPSARLLAFNDPRHVAMEGIRSLRTSLWFGLIADGKTSIAVTSPSPNAGKSFIATNIAVVAAQTGMKVCLVDADLRRGKLSAQFTRENTPNGLAQILAKEVNIADTIISGGHENLDVIPSGARPETPSELLMQPGLEELVKALVDLYDLVVFDTPPALAVTDPLIVSRATAATLLVVRHCQTDASEITGVRTAYDAARLDIAGSVLNGFDPRRAQSYGVYGYQYRYSYTAKKT